MSRPARCGLCSAVVPADHRTCDSCGLRWISGAPPDHGDERLSALAGATDIRLSCGMIRCDGLEMPLETLRSLASRFDRTARLGGFASLLLGRIPARLLSGRVDLFDAGVNHCEAGHMKPASLALGCLARPADLPALVRLATDHGSRFSAMAVMLDGLREEAIAVRSALEAAPGAPPITVESHPLSNDFGAQRNRLQRLAATRWILHLDTDETPDRRLAANLRWIVEDAEAYGNHVVGFPRLNLVDGIPSAFYPDIQYRLVRADIAFVGTVHESPLPALHWRRVHRSLAGTIHHRLSGDRVRARSVRYETIAQGAGKPGDERQLLERWDDIEPTLWLRA